MSILKKGSAFQTGGEVTATKRNELVDKAEFDNPVEGPGIGLNATTGRLRLLTGGIVASLLGNASVLTAKIAAAAVTAAKLANDAVETAKIKDGAVTEGKLAEVFRDRLLEYRALWVDEKVSGSGSQPGVTQQWVTRDLNKERFNEIPGAALNAGTGEITLPAGVAYVRAVAPAHRVNRHRARLWRTSGTPGMLPEAFSNTAYDDKTDGRTNNFAVIEARLVLSEETDFRLEHILGSPNSLVSGFGVGDSEFTGLPEVFSMVAVTWRKAQ